VKFSPNHREVKICLIFDAELKTISRLSSLTTHRRTVSAQRCWTSVHRATLAYAVGKKIVRAYLDGGTRTADRVVDDIAPQLFETEDMRAGVAALLEHGSRAFRDNVVFRGR